jgi:hypothetical protein
MRNRIRLFLAIFLLNHPLYSQNLDLLTIHAAGKSRGMAGAGIGIADGVSAFDLNPAGLSNTRYVSFTASQSFHYYAYSLLRVNSGSGSGVLDIPWSDSRYNFENLLVVAPVRKNFGAGMGYIQKLAPFLKNSARAITGSSLINQLTSGNVHALTVAFGAKLFKNFSLGLGLARYDGSIASKLRGDNHGQELDKAARLQSDLNGNHVQIGATFSFPQISAGLVWESPAELEVTAQRESSADSSYKNFFPNYAQTRWKLPAIIRGGLAYTGLKNCVIAIDFERHQYDKSNVQLNLYEFGRPPNWKDVNIFRIGIELLLSQTLNLPLRLGYARIPQLYASNTASSVLPNPALVSHDTQQNIANLLTAGTTISFSKMQLHTGVEYKKLVWHRDTQTTVKISDDYTERNYAVFVELVYSLK